MSLEEKNEQIEDLINNLEIKEREFKQLGGLHKTQMDELKDSEKQHSLDYERLVKQLKEAIATQVSVCFFLPLKKEWINRIESEKIRTEWLIKRQAIEPKISSLIEKIVGDNAPQPSPELTSEQRNFLSKRIQEEVVGLFQPPPAQASKDSWFDLRQQEIDKINNQLNEAIYFTKTTLKDIIERKQRVYDQRHRIQEQLRIMSGSQETAKNEWLKQDCLPDKLKFLLCALWEHLPGQVGEFYLSLLILHWVD